MGADNSRIYSPSEDEEWWYNRSNYLLSSEGKEPTTTTIDIGFAIRANGVPKNGDLSVLRRMVSYPPGCGCASRVNVCVCVYREWDGGPISVPAACLLDVLGGRK